MFPYINLFICEMKLKYFKINQNKDNNPSSMFSYTYVDIE